MSARRLAINARFHVPFTRGCAFSKQHGPVPAELRRLCFIAEIRDEDYLPLGALPQTFEMVWTSAALPLEVDRNLGILTGNENTARILDDVTTIVLMTRRTGNRAQEPVRFHYRCRLCTARGRTQNQQEECQQLCTSSHMGRHQDHSPE